MPEVFENFSAMQRAYGEDYLYPFGSTGMNDYPGSTGMNDHIALSRMNEHLGILSPSNSSVDSHATSSAPSPMSVSSSPPHNASSNPCPERQNIQFMDPYIRFIEQPVEKFRFRYKSEMMGTHGSLAGANSSGSRKKPAPTVELVNYHGPAIIRCTLVTADPHHRGPHAHHLVCRAGNDDRDDPHEIEVSQDTGYQASFQGMGIIHTAKKHIKEELFRKMKQQLLEENRRKNINVTALSVREDTQLKVDAEAAQKWMNLNSVALCFQAFVRNAHGVLTPITQPIYSNAINNLKSALTGELKICRIDKFTSSCEGGEEVFILVEKVGKKNIRIKFFEMDEDEHEIWSDYGRFSELDVHHQYAIVFRTPPYKDREITSPKEVFVQLYRPTDGDCSVPIKFTFKPSDRMMGRKRPRVSCNNSSSSSEYIPQLTSLQPATRGNSIELPSQNTSAEIRNLLEPRIPSDEMREFFRTINLDDYLGHMDDADTLVTDGQSTKEDNMSFARDTVLEIVKTIKDKPTAFKERVKALMKERTTYGDSPLHSALRYDQHELVKYIIMLLANSPEFKPFVDAQNSSGQTCLHCAILKNQDTVVKALLLLGADPNACDERGVSPLHAAVKFSEAGRCLDALLSAKPNLEARDDAGWTALHVAAEAGSVHAIRSLIKAGADVNDTDTSYGRTALHIAVEGGHKDIVQFLLKETSIDVNKTNFSGNTALHSAVVNTGSRAKELCELLMRYGADPSIANNNRESTKELRGEVSVKQEVDSEDEAVDEESGQTSLDLASDNPEMLRLLSGSTSKQEHSSTLGAVMEVKEEVLEEGENDRNRWLDTDTVSTLASILDRTKGWEKLAHQQRYDFLLGTMRKGETSPSLLLLNYIDVQGNVEASELRNILDTLGEEEAVKLIDNVLSKR